MEEEMEYSTFTVQARQPAQEYRPSEGISTGGVLTLAAIAAIAVLVKRSGRSRPRQQSQEPTAPRPQAPGELPSVSMEELRGDAPVAPRPQSAPGKPGLLSEKGKALLLAPAAKAQAHHLDIPPGLAARLQTGPWGAMCRARKLTGLKRGELEKTPYGVAVHVEFGGSLDFAAVQRSVDQLETGLDVVSGTVRLRRGRSAGRGVLDVRIRDPLADGVPWEAPSGPVRLSCPLRLAVTPFGDTLGLDVKQRVGVFGTSGSGKSCVQRLIGAHVAQAADAQLEIWDLKFGVESQHYQGKAHRVTTAADAVSRLEELLGTEYPRRAAKLRERGVSQWTETPWDPARVIIIDEGNALVRELDTQQLARLFTAVEQGRALGVYWVWATQYPKAASLPTEIRSQLNATVCLKLRTDTEARVVFGDDVAEGWAPHDLLGPGWLLLKDDAHADPVDAKAVWLSVDSFRAVPASVLDRTAGQDGRTGRPDRTAGQDSRTGQPDRTAGQDSRTGQPDRTASTVSLDIWTVLALSDGSLPLSEIARRSERSKSAVHAALGKMAAEGSVTRDGDGYRLKLTGTDCG
jgi:hypothetical protein